MWGVSGEWGGVEECAGSPHTLLHLSPLRNTLSPTSPRPSRSPHTLFRTSPILPHILPHTLPHSSPTFSHSLHIPPYLTQLPKLPKIPQFPRHPYSPNFSILPRSFPILPHTYLSLIPHQNFSLIAKFSLAIK